LEATVFNLQSNNRIGRPFHSEADEAVDQDGKEDKVKEKRGIFRLLKRMIGNLTKTD